MSEFGCYCGGIFCRNKKGVMCCPKCGSIRPYTMDGYTDSQLAMMEQDYEDDIEEVG